MQRLYDSGDINSQYIMSLFSEEYEKNVYDAYVNKVLLNGQVVSLGDYNEYVGTKKTCDKLVKIFYQGEELTEFELDLEKIYLAEKLTKHMKYKRRPVRMIEIKL
jgi:hypothetical protein